MLAFTKEVYIDRSDFEEVPPPKFFRMKPDGEVRLMGAYIIKCGEIVKDEDGNIHAADIIWGASQKHTLEDDELEIFSPKFLLSLGNFNPKTTLLLWDF